MEYTLCLFCGGNRSEANHLARCDGRQGGVEERPFVPYEAFEHARTTDPDTSHAAAAAVVDATEVQLRVYGLLVHRMTDEELMAAYATTFGEWRVGESASSPRKRRSDLTRMGWVVDSGERRRLRSGRNGIVWCRKR